MNSVTVNGTTITLNKDLIEKQKLDLETVATILGLHARKAALLQEMETAPEFSWEAYARDIRSIEFALQRSWGFPQSENFHRWWNLPHCSCPKLDNEERYGTAQLIIDKECPVHKEWD